MTSCVVDSTVKLMLGQMCLNKCLVCISVCHIVTKLFHVSDKCRVQTHYDHASTVKISLAAGPTHCKSAENIWEEIGAAGTEAERHVCHGDGKNSNLTVITTITFVSMLTFQLKCCCVLCINPWEWHWCQTGMCHQRTLHLPQRGSWGSCAGVRGKCMRLISVTVLHCAKMG